MTSWLRYPKICKEEKFMKPIFWSKSTTKYLKNFTVDGRNYLRVLYKEKRNGVYHEEIYYMSEGRRISKEEFEEAAIRAGNQYYNWCEVMGGSFSPCPVEYGETGKWSPWYKDYY